LCYRQAEQQTHQFWNFSKTDSQFFGSFFKLSLKSFVARGFYTFLDSRKGIKKFFFLKVKTVKILENDPTGANVVKLFLRVYFYEKISWSVS
jgi:hypothetical protein